MKLFNRTSCCKESMKDVKTNNTANGIKVLGSGCKKCQSLETSVRSAIEELGMNVDVEHITDYAQIASYGVMSTPALVVNGKVVSFGKVLSVEEVKTILSKE